MDSSSQITPKFSRIPPKVEFKRDEYIVLTLPREVNSGFDPGRYPFRLSIDDALEVSRQLADALEAAGYGASKCNPDCHV